MGKKKAKSAATQPPAGAFNMVPLRKDIAKRLCERTVSSRIRIVEQLQPLLLDSPDIAATAADALRRVVIRAEQRDALRRAGVPVLTQSLVRHGTVTRLVKAVSETLLYVLNTSPAHTTEALPAVAPLVSALTTFNAQEDVIVQILSALRSLTTEAAGHEALASNGAAFGALLSTLQRYRMSDAVVEQVIGVWRNLARSPGPRALLSHEKFFVPLVSALSMHANKNGVVVQAARTLQALAVDSENEAPLVTAGAIPPLLRILSPAGEMCGSANPVDAALRALRNLAALPRAKGLIVQQKGIDYALFALSTHAQQSKVVEAAASLLWSLGHYDEIESAELPRPSQIAESLAKALRQYREELPVVLAVCGALWTLALPESDFSRGLRALATAPPPSQLELVDLLPTLRAIATGVKFNETARSYAAGAADALRRP